MMRAMREVTGTYQIDDHHLAAIHRCSCVLHASVIFFLAGFRAATSARVDLGHKPVACICCVAPESLHPPGDTLHSSYDRIILIAFFPGDESVELVDK